MKIVNDLIVFDLEMTSNQETEEDRPAIQTNNYIIEIGARHINRDLEIAGHFDAFVKPEERITPFIEKITGITNEMVSEEQLWSVVGQNFADWVGRCTKIKTARLMAHGNYFDMPALRKSYEKYSIPFPFSGTCFDAKTIMWQWMCDSGRKSDKLSIEHVASVMGIKPCGAYHRASTDADTLAKIVIRALKDRRDGFFIPGKDGQPYRYAKFSVD